MLLQQQGAGLSDLAMFLCFSFFFFFLPFQCFPPRIQGNSYFVFSDDVSNPFRVAWMLAEPSAGSVYSG